MIMGAEIGTLIVETIAKIRRLFFAQGKPIKVICRELGLSRKVVRKVIRSKATEFHYEREAQPLPKIGPWSDKLDQLLLANEAKVARERLTLIRLFEELCGLGYDGGYDAVRRYARRWAKGRGQSMAVAYVPLSFASGEAYRFDWSHEIVLLNGVTVTVKAAHARLCHSGTVGVFVCEAVFRHASTKRSLNITANRVFASNHSRGGRFQSAAAWFKTKYSSLAAASSEGKWPLVLMALRNFEFSASMAFVV